MHEKYCHLPGCWWRLIQCFRPDMADKAATPPGKTKKVVNLLTPPTQSLHWHWHKIINRNRLAQKIKKRAKYLQHVSGFDSAHVRRRLRSKVHSLKASPSPTPRRHWPKNWVNLPHLCQPFLCQRLQRKNRKCFWTWKSFLFRVSRVRFLFSFPDGNTAALVRVQVQWQKEVSPLARVAAPPAPTALKACCCCGCKKPFLVCQ